jgi:hypothetical protein
MSDTDTESMGWWPEQPSAEQPIEAQPIEAQQPIEQQPVEQQSVEQPVDVPPSFQVPDPPRTGDAEVDAAVVAVAEAVSSPLEEQVAVYEAAHRTLQDRLADVEG